jgi:ribulose-5-phosphate 4-epimerase/fuculose-1-phosphate aldolase
VVISGEGGKTRLRPPTGRLRSSVYVWFEPASALNYCGVYRIFFRYHPYEGITEDFGERERILKNLGRNRALIMHNHGFTTVGKNAREAFVLMKYLMSASEIQMRIEATGKDAIEIEPAICEKAAAQYETHDAGRGSADWPAYLRQLDSVDPGYRN